MLAIIKKIKLSYILSQILTSGIPKPQTLLSFLWIACFSLLSACGGGGGGSSSDEGGDNVSETLSPSPIVAPPVVAPDADAGPISEKAAAQEFGRSYALSTVNAERAYEMGITGDGVTVAVIDTGANGNISELKNAINPDSTSLIANKSVNDDETGHGTSVAAVIAAARDGMGTMGLSYNAGIIAIKADEPAGGFNPFRLRQAVNYAVQKNADIINFSIAGANEPPFSFKQAVAGAVDAGILMVIAAGNNGLRNPEYPAAYAGTFEGPGQVIAVGAVNERHEIADFSNRAGDSRNAFLVAPGANLQTVDATGNVTTVSGTSFAAPLVSAAAALLKEHAPNLTGREIAEILLTTATDIGVPGIDSVYGHGLLDVSRALEPYGVTTLGSAGTDFDNVNNTILHLSPAFAEAMVNSKILSSVFAKDAYQREYDLDLRHQLLNPSLQSTSANPLGGWLQIAAVENHDGNKANALWQAGGLALSVAKRPHDETWQTLVPASTQNNPNHHVFIAAHGNHASQTQATLGLSLAHQVAQTRFAHGTTGLLQQTSLDEKTQLNPFLKLAQDYEQTTSTPLPNQLSLLHRREIHPNLAMSFGVSANAAQFESSPNPFAAFTQSLDAATLRRNSAHSALVATAAWQATPRLSLQSSIGQIRETGTFLNSVGAGALGFYTPIKTHFIDTSIRFQPGPNLSLYASYAFGRTQNAQQSLGLIREISGVTSDAFNVGLAKRNALINSAIARSLRQSTRAELDDKLDLSISQPLRVRSGTMHFQMMDGQQHLNLSPSGRQIDAALTYSLSARHADKRRDTIALKAGISRHPGHDASARPSRFVGIKMHRSF